MTQLKREQMDRQAAREAETELDKSGLAPAARRRVLEETRAQKKLDIVMAQDNTVAQVYQESYKAAKEDGEREMDELRDLHDRFDYYLDEERMANKQGSYWYDLKAIDDGAQIEYSTDFTDAADDALYKRYKLARFRSRESVKDHQAKIDKIVQAEEAGRQAAAELGSPEEEAEKRRTFKDAYTRIAQLREKKFQYLEVDRRLEDAIAEMKYQKALRHKEKTRQAFLYDSDDPYFGEEEPDWRLDPAHFKRMQLLPEIRKMEYSTLLEKADSRAFDEESARDLEEHQRITLTYYKAKLAFFEDAFENQVRYKLQDFDARYAELEYHDQ